MTQKIRSADGLLGCEAGESGIVFLSADAERKPIPGLSPEQKLESRVGFYEEQFANLPEEELARISAFEGEFAKDPSYALQGIFVDESAEIAAVMAANRILFRSKSRRLFGFDKGQNPASHL